jgi:hypothetical protein
MTSKNAENVIEIRVDAIAQLFHTLDPFPFREKDLDREAEEYIVGWARELPDQPFRLVVHFPDDELQTDLARYLAEALSKYFASRAVVIQRDLNELFRIGRRSLAIGATPHRLSACSKSGVRAPSRGAVQEGCGRKLPDLGTGRQLAAA